MTAQEFADLVLELNEKVDGNAFLEDLGLCFSYHTNFYCDQITFGEFPVYCSQNNSLFDFKTDIELTVKEVLIRNFNEYVKALNTIKLQ